jgi:hypothetical protein
MMLWWELEEKALASIRPMSKEERDRILEIVAIEELEADLPRPAGLRRRLAALLVGAGAWLDPEIALVRSIEGQF